jgi:hypothetical protein
MAQGYFIRLRSCLVRCSPRLKTLSQWLHGNLGDDFCAFMVSDEMMEGFDIASVAVGPRLSTSSNATSQVCKTESQVVAR